MAISRKLLGNVCAKTQNLAELMKVRERVASFEDNSHFIGENFRQLEPALKLMRTKQSK